MTSPTPLHIALVSTQANWHGGEKQAALLAWGLQRRGHRCSIICREDGEFAKQMAGPVSGGPVSSDQSGNAFEIHHIPRRVRSPRAILRMRRTLQAIQPDILHANDAHALTASGVAALGLSVPLRIAARRVDFPLRSARKYQWFADGLICVSNEVARICVESGLPSDRLQVVHDGVEPAFAESGCRNNGRRRLGLHDQQPLLLTVAKLTDHKGHRYLLQAVPQLIKSHPDLVVALAGDGELRSELESMTADLGIGSHVRFLGYRNDVSDLMAAADLIVQPSHMEGLCSSLIDAMFAARPIVASHAGGIPDLLDVQASDPSVAWLVPPREPQQLAQAINDALCNPERAESRGKAARARALRQFTAEQMVESTLNAYEAIATRRYGAPTALSSLSSNLRNSAQAARSAA